MQEAPDWAVICITVTPQTSENKNMQTRAEQNGFGIFCLQPVFGLCQEADRNRLILHICTEEAVVLLRCFQFRMLDWPFRLPMSDLHLNLRWFCFSVRKLFQMEQQETASRPTTWSTPRTTPSTTFKAACALDSHEFANLVLQAGCMPYLAWQRIKNPPTIS